ncbi:MAG: cyclic nucleotide-binding domain-containing protein [Rhodospirillaceae bacterium]|nr:cyclic nucleotide-binding domain-containing protein [Rhodospirillaceae bacterium]
MAAVGATPLIQPLPRSSAETNPCAACGVRDLSICGAIEPEHLGKLNAIVMHKRLQPGETLFFEGDRSDSLYIITEGCVRLHKMLADGRRQITGFLFPSDFLGLALRERYAYSAEAVDTVALCRYPKARLEALLDQFPAMERRLLAVASNELASAQDQMLLLGRKTAIERVASFILILLRRMQLKGKTDLVSLPMTRTDIGDYLGLTIETVSRSLSRLKRDRVVRFLTAQDMQIVDTKRLVELAGAEEEWMPATTVP